MIGAECVTPIVDLIAAHEWFVANRAARCDGVGEATWVARLSFVDIETAVVDWLLTDDTAKVFGMPVGIHGAEVAAINRLRALFAETGGGHGL